MTSSREEEASVESGLRAEVIGEAGGMGALADDWLRLQAAAGRDIHFFQTYEWCGAWVNRGMDGRRERPLIVCVRRDDDLVLLWPLMLTRMGPLRIMRWLSDPFAQYGDVLTSLDGAALGAALDVAWRRILATGGVDIVRLRHVRADSTVGNFLAGRCLLADEDGAPWLDLSRFDDEAAYDRRYDRRQRRRRKRIRKRLEKDFGEVAFRFVGPVDVAGVVDRLVAEKRRWLEEKGYYSRPLECPELAGFFRCLPVAATSEEAMEDVPLMVVSELVAGDRAVSWELSFRWRGRHYCYITAHDNDLTPYSPGRLHMDLSQKRALADGVVAFDLLVSNAPHKRS
ncbi:MAG TPA: GNAT family N-acetyltransferase, partial [Bryobacterales bacterium]|nr:GNAT family N-acetyltransferase [Bryobacterales bacterium]